jgi:hypothetical protein
MIISNSNAISDHEWDETTCILSYSNPAIIKDGYTLTVADFDGYGKAHINISRDGKVIDSVALKNNEANWVSADNGNIKLKGLGITDQEKLSWIGNWPDDPKAEIIIKTKREQTSSRISIEIDMDDEEYILDEIVTPSFICGTDCITAATPAVIQSVPQIKLGVTIIAVLLLIII